VLARWGVSAAVLSLCLSATPPLQKKKIREPPPPPLSRVFVNVYEYGDLLAAV
jgi:hypothetical protein